MSKGPWGYGGCRGGVMLERNGDDMALIHVGHRCAYSTALKRARRMVRLLNAGEAALAPSTPPPRAEFLDEAAQVTASVPGRSKDSPK